MPPPLTTAAAAPRVRATQAQLSTAVQGAFESGIARDCAVLKSGVALAGVIAYPNGIVVPVTITGFSSANGDLGLVRQAAASRTAFCAPPKRSSQPGRQP